MDVIIELAPSRPETTLAVTRGAARLLVDLGYAPLAEVTLPNGRRADLMALGPKGDVLIVAVDAIPTNATPVARSKRGVILAEGEVTGHAHRIPSRHANLFRTESDARYMRVEGTAPVALNHEEHTTVDIPPGNYRVTIHHEYQPSAIVRVED